MNARRAVIIDDDRFIRGILDRTLSNAGFITAHAGDGQEGLEVIEAFLPKLVILDIFMPGDFDGVEVCRKLRNDERFREMVIVMISSSDPRIESRRSLEAGADIFIPKPFSPKQFLQQVILLLREKGGVQ
jgi:DNA-binding response OmpR family regulator